MNLHTVAGRTRHVAGTVGLVAASVVFSATLSAQERKPLATLEGHAVGVKFLSFRPDGKAIASGSRDSTIKLWDVATGRCTATVKEADPKFWESVAFSPDGKTLATGGWFKMVKVWDAGLRNGRLLLDESEQSPETLVVFSPDGKTLATGGMCRGEMLLFDVASGRKTAALVTSKKVNPWGVIAMDPANQTTVR